MKKIIFAIFYFGVSIIMLSCSHQIINENRDSFSEDEGVISKTYYTKNVSNSFSEFLFNMNDESKNSIDTRSSRTLENDTQIYNSEEKMFAQMWSELSDDEKKLILENSENIDIHFNSAIGIQSDSSVGRAILSGDTHDIDLLAEYYGVIETLKEIGKNKTIPVTCLSIGFSELGCEEVNAVSVLEMYMRNSEWKKIREVLNYIGEENRYKELKEKWESLEYERNLSNGGSRASLLAADGDYEIPIQNNVGSLLNDGDILVTCNRKKAWVIVGDWSHGGIFSKELYIAEDLGDASYCVYTAEPGTYDKNYKPEKDNDPDRWGVACKETIYTYTKAKRFAVLHPKNYSETKAKSAVNEAKTIYYDALAPYDIPVSEIFFWGNTSHDLTSQNTYCTKVAYTAWKKNGVDIDAGNFAGNLVTPDDVYGSSIERSITLTISFLWWSYSKKWITYEPTTTVLMEKSR